MATQLVYPGVKCYLPLNRLDIIPSLPGGFETGIAPPKFGKIVIRTFLPRLFKGKSFKSCSHGIKFAELGLTDRAHPQSLVGCLNEQAIFSQLQHGFAQRATAYGKAVCQFRFGQPLTRREVT